MEYLSLVLTKCDDVRYRFFNPHIYFQKGKKMMINNAFKTLVVSLFLMQFYAVGINVIYNEQNNKIEIVHEFDVVQSQDAQVQDGLSVFTPAYPYNTVTFGITAPSQVVLGQEFTIYFTVQSMRASNIPFWADLIPDPSQDGGNGVEYISSTAPTTGEYDLKASSILRKGGKTKWSFKKGLPANSIQKLAITFRATKEGTKKYTTFIATNPPSFFAMETQASPNLLRANPDHAVGIQGLPLTIPVICNDISDLPVEIVEVSQPARGSVKINDDNSITYMQTQDFIGEDNFMYTIQDALGNTSSAEVMVTFVEYPKSEILR